MELMNYFDENPIVDGKFLKVNYYGKSNIYISNTAIKGFKVIECSGEIYDEGYSFEVVFDYKLFDYNIEELVACPITLKELKDEKEAEKVIELLLKALYN